MERKDLFVVQTRGEQLRERARKERGCFVRSDEKVHEPMMESSQKSPSPIGSLSKGDNCFVVDWCMVK